MKRCLYQAWICRNRLRIDRYPITKETRGCWYTVDAFGRTRRVYKRTGKSWLIHRLHWSQEEALAYLRASIEALPNHLAYLRECELESLDQGLREMGIAPTRDGGPRS